ncbi:MAG: polysaccharide biosynthesis/export family protein [Gemmataceae bacterium]|nr:polysaccharide biosynthesis/export family protein [Gemmataceae bacterium]
MSKLRSHLVWLCFLAAGCASFTNPVADAIPVRQVPEECLVPSRDDEATIPLSLLSLPADAVHRVAPGDTLGIWIEGVLGVVNQIPPLHISTSSTPRDQRRANPSVGVPVPVEQDGRITLPLVDRLSVAGMTVGDIQKLLRAEYTDKRKILKAGNDRILVSVLQARTVRVLVLRQESPLFIQGATGEPVPGGKRGTGQLLEMPTGENDLLHALTLSGGLPGLDAYNKVVVFRNGFRTDLDPRTAIQQFEQQGSPSCAFPAALSIPLRAPAGQWPKLGPTDITLQDGDIVFLEARDREVFYTAGLIPSGEHVLPRDRSLDVLQAIAMVRGPILNGAFGTNNLAGNLVNPGIGGPSPSLLVVLRKTPGGHLPIRVDLNQAMMDARERIIIQPGDVLLLQEHPREAFARYISQTFFTWNLSYSRIAGGGSAGNVVGIAATAR